MGSMGSCIIAVVQRTSAVFRVINSQADNDLAEREIQSDMVTMERYKLFKGIMSNLCSYFETSFFVFA